MKLSKREKNLLLLTFLVVIGACYYFFVFEKLSAKISTLKDDLATTQTTYDLQQSVLSKAANISRQIEELKKEIFPIATKYYGKTEQEEFIAEIDKINQKSGIDIINIVFSEDKEISLAEPKDPDEVVEKPVSPSGDNGDASQTSQSSDKMNSNSSEPNLAQNNGDSKVEENAEQDKSKPNDKLQLTEIEKGAQTQETARTKEENIKLMQAEITFSATYPQIIKWLNAVDNNPKVIISGKLELKRESDELVFGKNNSLFLLDGKVRLSFYQVKDVDKYDTPLVTFLKTKPIAKGKNSNPFKSYSWAWKKIESESPPVTNLPEFGGNGSPNVGNPIVPNRFPSVGVEKPVSASLNKVGLYDFEDEAIEIKKSDEKIVAMGEIESKIVAKGKFAGKVQYNFLGNSSDERVMIDLSGKQLLLDKKMESISFLLYAEQEMMNEVGLIITDSKNQDYQIVMANEISWRGWKELNYDFHGVDSYPIKVKGIYVSYGEKGQTKNGKLIFDDINISSLSMKN